MLLIGGANKGKNQTIERLCEAHFKHDPMAVFGTSFVKEVTGKECWLGGALKDPELIADSELQLNGEMKAFGEVSTAARQFFCDTWRCWPRSRA